MSVRTILLSALMASAFTNGQQASQDESPMLLLSEDESFHFEMLVPLAESIYSGGDIGPVLGAVKDIKPGDFESFSESFYQLANHTKAQAEDPENAFDPVNVRDTWFSAATYFRRADFYLHGNWNDPRINEYWDEHLAAFDKANAALPIPGKRVQIPAGDFDVEAIWYSASKECEKRPTLILGNGYDGSQEDLYHTVVVPALARGWNAITYEGPGHPTVRRRQNKGFIPDWERVVTPVVDYLHAEKADEVNLDKLVLFGFSFGGYLSARAAAFEPRLAAVILNGGIWSVYEAFTSQLDPAAFKVLESGNKEKFDEIADQLLAQPNVPSNIRWGLEQGKWSFNKDSAYDFLTACKEYTVADVIDRIKVPVWVVDAEHEGFFSEQAPKVAEALGDRATYTRFNGTAGYHCQIGAFQEMTRTMFTWLNRNLA